MLNLQSPTPASPPRRWRWWRWRSEALRGWFSSLSAAAPAPVYPQKSPESVTGNRPTRVVFGFNPETWRLDVTSESESISAIGLLANVAPWVSLRCAIVVLPCCPDRVVDGKCLCICSKLGSVLQRAFYGSSGRVSHPLPVYLSTPLCLFARLFANARLNWLRCDLYGSKVKVRSRICLQWLKFWSHFGWNPEKWFFNWYHVWKVSRLMPKENDLERLMSRSQ